MVLNLNLESVIHDADSSRRGTYWQYGVFTRKTVVRERNRHIYSVPYGEAATRSDVCNPPLEERCAPRASSRLRRKNVNRAGIFQAFGYRSRQSHQVASLRLL